MNDAKIATYIEATLREALPSGRRRDIATLADLLAAAATRDRSPDDVGRELSSAPQLLPLLKELAGARVNANGTAVGFSGDIITVDTIQNSDVVAIGRNAVAIKLNMSLAPAFSVDEARRRGQMIAKVRALWITGVLEHSIQHVRLVSLGLEPQESRSRHPWQLIGQWIGKPEHELNPDISMTDVFDQVGKELLLLGEAGSGKTTALLMLARDLLDRAESDDRQPIPIIFNLSSFSAWQRSFREWLIAELSLRYLVPRPIALRWITTGALLPMLDGLDEVADARRDDCVVAINTFRRVEYGLDQIIVCSRIDDYAALQQQLLIPAVIKVLPISAEQLTTYLEGAGDQIRPVRELLAHDRQLAEMARTPLMLSMILLAYESAQSAPALVAGPLEARRAQVFDQYIARMLSYPEGERIYGIDLPKDASSALKLPYSPEQILSWLGWLAAQMRRRDKSLFLIEELQPDWLAPRSRWLYVLFLMLIIVLFLGLVGGLGRWLAFTPALGFLLGTTGFWSWGGLLVLAYGLLLILRAKLLGVGTDIPLFALDAALIYGMTGVTVVASQTLRVTKHLRLRLRPQPIRVVERLVWSWPRALRGIGRSMAIGTLIMALLVLIANIINRSGDGGSNLTPGQWIGGLAGAILGFGMLICNILMPIWGLSAGEIQERIRPGQGISQTSRNALTVGFATSTGILVLSGIEQLMLTLKNALYQIDRETAVYAFVEAFTRAAQQLIGLDLSYQLTLSLGIGLAASLWFGGFACMQHFLLRVCLQREAAIPRDLVDFLNFATQRRLLFRAGGSYKFIHNRLRDHLALMESETIFKEEPHDESAQQAASDHRAKNAADPQTAAE